MENKSNFKVTYVYTHDQWGAEQYMPIDIIVAYPTLCKSKAHKSSFTFQAPFFTLLTSLVITVLDFPHHHHQESQVSTTPPSLPPSISATSEQEGRKRREWAAQRKRGWFRWSMTSWNQTHHHHHPPLHPPPEPPPSTSKLSSSLRSLVDISLVHLFTPCMHWFCNDISLLVVILLVTGNSWGQHAC